jgi:hypothetical protein
MTLGMHADGQVVSKRMAHGARYSFASAEALAWRSISLRDWLPH